MIKLSKTKAIEPIPDFWETERAYDLEAAYQFIHGACGVRKYTFEEAKEAFQVADDRHIFEIKENGTRYWLQIRPQGANQNFLNSRHISKKTLRLVEKQDSAPVQIRDSKFPTQFWDTVFDGEIVSRLPGSDHCDAVHSLAQGSADFIVWDIVWYQGRDLRGESLAYRWELLHRLFVPFFPGWMRLIKRFSNPKEALQYIIEHSKEGLVRKDTWAEYGDGWTKIKEQDNFDAVIWGFEPTNSKAFKKQGLIGSLRIGQWCLLPQGVPINKDMLLKGPTDSVMPGSIFFWRDKWMIFKEFGTCGGFDMAYRRKFSKNKAFWVGRVIEIRCQRRLKSGKFESPRFFRERGDKSHVDCLFIAK